METNICKLKFRRGIEADRKTITPEEGEPIFTTDTHRFCIGDGKTLGGITFPKLYVGDDSNAVPGDLAYKDENLWLHTSDTDSVAIGGTQSIKVGDGIEKDNNKLTVKPASGISVDASGVSVNVDYIKSSVGITEIDNRINTLSANAVVSPLAPLYNTSTIYAYTAYNVKVPLTINDTGLAPVTSVNGVDVYSFTSSATAIAKNVPDVTHVGINDGCVLNCDNTIRFDYSPTPYIQGYSTSVDENDITTYTLSTIKVNVPVFSVAGTKPDIADGSITEAMIADGSITEAKLSQEVQNKLNAEPDIADGSITNVKLKDSTITGDKLADGIITTEKLANDSVTTEKIVAGSITSSELADKCVTADKLDDGILSKLTTGTVGFPDYANSTNFYILEHSSYTVPYDGWIQFIVFIRESGQFSFRINGSEVINFSAPQTFFESCCQPYFIPVKSGAVLSWSGASIGGALDITLFKML